jgi:hypothetical protein
MVEMAIDRVANGSSVITNRPLTKTCRVNGNVQSCLKQPVDQSIGQVAGVMLEVLCQLVSRGNQAALLMIIQIRWISTVA